MMLPHLGQGRVLLHEEHGEAGHEVRGQLRGRDPGQQGAGQAVLVTVIMSGGRALSALWSAQHKYRDTEIQVNTGNTVTPGEES